MRQHWFVFLVACSVWTCVCATLAVAKAPGGTIVPVSYLGRPQTVCTSYPESDCAMRGEFGAITLSPHVLRPGEILTATVVALRCPACEVTWPVTGSAAGTNLLLSQLRLVAPCSKFASRCRWRVVARPIWQPFQEVEFTIIPGAHVDGSEGSIVSDYAGIDGYEST